MLNWEGVDRTGPPTIYTILPFRPQMRSSTALLGMGIAQSFHYMLLYTQIGGQKAIFDTC